MQRSIAGALPGLSPEQATTEAAAVTGKRRLPRWLLVVGFWTLIVLAYSTRTELRTGPYIWAPMTWLESLRAAAAQWYSWGLLSPFIFWVNRKLPFARDALIPRLLAHIPLSLAFTVVYSYLQYLVTTLLGAPTEIFWVGATLLETTTRVMYRMGTFVYWAIVAICVAFDYQSELKDREVRGAELERLLTEARLATLRTQFDPHFLFNTLNSISAYVESAPRDARLMIEQLGDLLRLSLEHADEQEIQLDRELMFVDRYIQLQLVRFADRLDVRVDADHEVRTAAVPTFLLQPLIENAIRHGVAKLTTPGVIALSAWRDNDRLHVRVGDNGPGLPAGWSLETHAGVGLGNTRARLEHLYGKGEFALAVTSVGGRGTTVDITIPYRVA